MIVTFEVDVCGELTMTFEVEAWEGELTMVVEVEASDDALPAI